MTLPRLIGLGVLTVLGVSAVTRHRRGAHQPAQPQRRSRSFVESPITFATNGGGRTIAAAPTTVRLCALTSSAVKVAHAAR